MWHHRLVGLLSDLLMDTLLSSGFFRGHRWPLLATVGHFGADADILMWIGWMREAALRPIKRLAPDVIKGLILP